MHTLTVTGRTMAGKPDSGDLVIVLNADDISRFGDPEEQASIFYKGVTKYSVPPGHYWGFADFTDVSRGKITGSRLVVLPQFTVAGTTTVHTAARSASSKITMATPRPATPVDTNFTVWRSEGSGGSYSTGISNFGIPIWVSPVSKRPTVGTMRANAAQVLVSPPGHGVPYQYGLSYADPAGIISSQHYRAGPSDLATVDELYYQSPKTAGDWFVDGEQPALNAGAEDGASYPLSLPGRRILYVGGSRQTMAWSSFYGPSGALVPGGQSQDYAGYPAGRRYTDDWNRYPLHPSANVNLDPAADYTTPSATRSGNILRLDITPFSDNQPGHTGIGLLTGPAGTKLTGSYQIDQDGKKIAGGNAVTAAGGGPDFHAQVRLRSGPSVIRFMLEASRTGKYWPLSTASRTVWTWRSARDPQARLHQLWYCWIVPSLVLKQHCAVQPMMTLRYGVQGMALDGVTRPGRQVLDITAGHLQLAKAAPITRAGVSVSFDGGRHWHAARMTRTGPGQYRAVFSAPAGAQVTTRTYAADAAGGSISETITRAYQISS